MLNAMCENCLKLGTDCKGETCLAYTGCLFKKVHIRKMYKLYTAHYSDGRTVREKQLEWIYRNSNGASVEIRPTIWLWKATPSGIYIVDYVGERLGCTLKTFEALTDAQEYRDRVASLDDVQFTRLLTMGKIGEV